MFEGFVCIAAALRCEYLGERALLLSQPYEATHSRFSRPRNIPFAATRAVAPERAIWVEAAI
jgi:hypothetical protein